MTLGKNPFELKKPLEEKPPVRPPITPPVKLPEVLPPPERPPTEGLPPIPPEGITYTVKDEAGKDIDLNILEDFEVVGTERRLRSEDYIVFYEGKEVGKYLRKTGTFEPYEPTWWEKTLGIGGKALEWLFVLPSFVGASIGYLGEELKKRWGMSDEEWEAYKKAGLPVASIKDIKKFLPGGEFHKRLQQTPFLTRLALEAPFWVGAAVGGVSALRTREAAKALPTALRVPVRAALAPIAGYEWVVGKTIQLTYNTGMSVVLRRNLHSWAKSAGVQVPKATEDAFVKQALRELSPKFMAKEAVKTLFRPTKAGFTVTEVGAKAAETAAAQAVRTSPLLLGIAKTVAPKVPPAAAIVPKVPTVAPLVTPPPTAVPEVTNKTAKEYIERAEGVDDIAETGLTVNEYAIDLIDGDIELAQTQGDRSWLVQLRRAKKALEGLGKPPAVEVAKPPVEPVTPPEPVIKEVEGVTEILASTEQKAMAHTLAKDKALINEAGKTRQQYRRLAENITDKKSMKDMTSEEASAFIDALEKYPDKKWSAKTGTWIPQPIPITKAIVPENYFNIKFGEPTPIKFFTSQNFYATKLGVGELTRPLELAKQRLDLEYPAWTKAVDAKIRDLNKVYKVTIAEKLIAVRNNIPTRAVSDMAKLLNKYEDLPSDIAAELGEDKVKLFSWFRNVDRTILSGENKVRELLNMPLIPHRKAYLRHIADRTANEIMQGNYSLPQDLAYWSKQIVGKKIFNPMSIQRKLSDDLLEHFSKDLNYITKSMIWTGLKEIHLSQPLQAFATQLNVLSKGNMPFGSLTSEELLRAQAISTLPASTRKWLVDYVNQVIKGQQTELDASVNRVITQTGIGGVLDKLLGEFGRSVGTRPMTVMAQFAGRVNILATIGTKPRQIIRNLFQTTQNLAIYGVTPTLQAELPAGKTLTRLLNNSLFLKSYARYEELPTSAMGKVERAWMWAYGKSAIINARKGMKAAFYPTVDYITNPKNKGLGWADPARTYTEKKGFLYPSEEENLLREMEYGAAATQYQYIAMGMPEIFRHKVLTPITRLQSWWMNYFAKFHREALHRFWTGSVGWNPNLKLPPSARLNWFKYLILGGAVLTAMGYKRSFMKDVLPHWGSPAVQFATGAYNYVIADSDYARESAKRAMSYSVSAFVPGMIDYKSWQAVWTGEKPMSSLFFYGEGWEPQMPTWGIPILEEENEIKRQINYVKDEVPIFKKLLGTEMPSEDGIEEYTYEMSDFASEIRALIRDIPDDRITEFSNIVQMYKRAETMWDTNYYSLPSSDRQEWLQQDTPESIWTGVYLALWGRLKVTGWVSGNPQTIELIRKLVDDFNIPSEAIPSLGELKEGAKDTRKRRPIIPRRTEGTEPTEQPSGSMGVNPFE